MSIIPIITARKLVLILLRLGFQIVRRKGSHVRIQHPVTRKSTTIPMHAGDLPRGLLLEILKQAGLSIEALLKLLSRK